MYLQALAINDRGYRTWGQLGRAYARSGEREKANQAFAKALEILDAEVLINPKSVILYSSQGFYRALMGRQDFVAPLERALNLDPERGETLLRAAETYAIAGRRQQAVEFLGRALARKVSMKSVQRSEYLKDIRPAVEAKK